MVKRLLGADNRTEISDVHFVSRKLITQPTSTIIEAFDTLALSCARLRGGQVEKMQRTCQVFNRSAFSSTFLVMAQAGQRVGRLVEVE